MATLTTRQLAELLIGIARSQQAVIDAIRTAGLANQKGSRLQQALRSDYSRFIDGESYAERTWALSALSAAGRANEAYAAELARRAQFLNLEAMYDGGVWGRLHGARIVVEPKAEGTKAP